MSRRWSQVNPPMPATSRLRSMVRVNNAMVSSRNRRVAGDVRPGQPRDDDEHLQRKPPQQRQRGDREPGVAEQVERLSRGLECPATVVTPSTSAIGTCLPRASSELTVG
jgi:hypothetical protein